MPQPSSAQTIAQWRREAVAALASVSDAPGLDADLMLAAQLDKPRNWLRLHDADPLAPSIRTALDRWLAQRLAHIPLAYLLGTQAFWTLEFEVTADTLVPRPETELLVERALALLAAVDGTPRLADLGTGCGNIALAIASERPDVQVTATDRSPAALAVATRNADRLGIGNVTFAEGDWCDALGGAQFDIIVSNPPYVESSYPGLAGELSAEPRSALASGDDGLDDIRRLVPALAEHIRTGGHVLLEHGHMQADAVSGILLAGQFIAPRTHTDLAGHPRVTEAQRAS